MLPWCLIGCWLRRALQVLLTALFAALLAQQALAFTPLAEPLRITIPAAPGGGWDQTARNLAAAMRSAGVVNEVVFDNRGTAPGVIGLGYFITSSKGDAQAWLIGGAPLLGRLALTPAGYALNQAMHVVPLARLTSEPLVVVVAASSKLLNLRDLLDALKAPVFMASNGSGVVTVGAPGAQQSGALTGTIGGLMAGGPEHVLAAGLMQAATGDAARLQFSPNVASGDAQDALEAGRVVAVVAGLSEFSEQLKTGSLRALAVSSAQRLAQYPAIASLREQGVDMELGNWRGLFAAVGLTPQQREAQLEAIRRTLDSAAWRATLYRRDWTAAPLFGEDFKRFIDAETLRAERLLNSPAQPSALPAPLPAPTASQSPPANAPGVRR